MFLGGGGNSFTAAVSFLDRRRGLLTALVGAHHMDRVSFRLMHV